MRKILKGQSFFKIRSRYTNLFFNGYGYYNEPIYCDPFGTKWIRLKSLTSLSDRVFRFLESRLSTTDFSQKEGLLDILQSEYINFKNSEIVQLKYWSNVIVFFFCFEALFDHNYALNEICLLEVLYRST